MTTAGYSFWAVPVGAGAPRRVAATYPGPDLTVWARSTAEAMRKATIEREQQARRAQQRAARRSGGM